MMKRTQRALSVSFLSFAILAALSVAFAGCDDKKATPDDKKTATGTASAATTGSAPAASAKPAGSGW